MAREKGKIAEREVAALLQAWWQPVDTGCVFVRVPMSGGWSTPRVRSTFRACGDVMTDAPRWPFAIEVKRREAWSVEFFMGGKRSPVWTWWAQTCRDAETAKAEPMLWIRRNRMPWNVVFRPPFMQQPERLGMKGEWVVGKAGSVCVVEAAILLASDPARMLASKMKKEPAT